MLTVRGVWTVVGDEGSILAYLTRLGPSADDPRVDYRITAVLDVEIIDFASLEAAQDAVQELAESNGQG